MLQVIRCPLARRRCTLAERTEGETKKTARVSFSLASSLPLGFVWSG